MKNIGMTLVLTVDEAKELLVDFFTETLANDKRLLRDKIVSSQLKDAIWNASQWSESYIVDNVQRPRLADDLAKKFAATTVMVVMSNGDHRIIWESPKKVTPENTIIVNHCGGMRDLRFTVQNDGTVKVEVNNNQHLCDGGEKKYEWNWIGTYPDTGTAIRQVLRQECGW